MSKREESLKLLRHELRGYNNRLNRLRAYKGELILPWEELELINCQERELTTKITKVKADITRIGEC